MRPGKLYFSNLIILNYRFGIIHFLIHPFLRTFNFRLTELYFAIIEQTMQYLDGEFLKKDNSVLTMKS